MSLIDFRGRLPGSRDRTAAAAVVEQRVDGLLQHALLVVDDDLGSAEVEQPLEAVVAVDDPAVQVVEVARREAAAVELHHRTDVRRDHGDRVEDHPRRVVLRATERRDDLEALDGLGALLALALADLRAQLLAEIVEVDLLEQVLDGLGAHAATEVGAVADLHLAVERLVVDEHLGRELLEGVERLGEHLLALGVLLLEIGGRGRLPSRSS
jgi:hypothetical protein